MRSWLDDLLDCKTLGEYTEQVDPTFERDPQTISVGNYADCVVEEVKKIAPPSEPAQESNTKIDNDDSSTGNDISQPAQIESEVKIVDENIQQEKDEKQKTETPPEDYPLRTRDADAIPNCPIDLRLPEKYKIDTFGIWRKKPMIGKNAGKENKWYSDHVSDTPMVITQRFIDVDTGEHFYEISWYDFNLAWGKGILSGKWIGGIIVPASTIANNIKCCALADYGLGISQSKAKYISEYLTKLATSAENRRLIPTKKLYNLPGWTNDDCNEFLYPTDDFAATDNFLKIASKSYVEKFKARGDITKWRMKIVALYDQISPIFRFVFATALAAPLIKILSVRNQQLHLWCKTGSGKSAVAKAAMSIYGDPNKLKSTFNATKKAIDETSATFNDLAAWLDELQLADPTFFKDNKDSPIYNFGEGAYRKRLNQRGDLTKKSQELPPIRGTRITTGEMPILSDNSNAGAYNRVLQISESTIFDDNIDIRELHKFFGENYGHFGRIWIDYIIKNKALIVKTFEDNLPKFEKYAEDNDFMDTANWGVTLAVLCTALQFAMPLVNPSKAFADDYAERNVFEKFFDGLNIIVKDVPKKDTAQNWQRAISGLQDYIAAHPRRFLHEIQAQEGTIPYLGYPTGVLPDNVVHGVIMRDKTVAFYPAELRNVIERELKFPSASPIIRDFAENAIFVLPKKENPKRHYQKSMWLPGVGGKWLYIFKADTLINTDQDETDPLDEILDED